MTTETLAESEPTTTTQPLVCAYVITYNGKKFLERCFKTLQQSTDYENLRLILLDNGSSDDSGDYVRQHFSGVDILRVFPNAGYSHGANQAIEDARRRGADYIVLMNDDIAILHPEWLGAAIAHAERDPSIGAVCFVEVNSEGEPTVAVDTDLLEVDYLSGAVVVFPVELLERIGGFDEVYFVIADENDLGARAQAAGYRIVQLGVPIYHHGGGTNQSLSRRMAYFQMRNGIRFCLKNHNPLRALMRAVRLLDIACNPWPLSFDSRDGAHRWARNSGNVVDNLLIWLQAVTWNIVRLPQTLRIRAAERRLIRRAIASRNNP